MTPSNVPTKPVAGEATLTGPATYLFAGGGTGGHITPGLAIAAELLRLDPAARIVFHGSGREVERRLVGAAGYELVTNRFPSSSELRRQPLRSIWRAGVEWVGGRRFLSKARVAAVIGLGGYASIPACLAARSAHVPLILLEQNVIPGRSVEWLAKRADLVCGAFDETAAHLPRGTRYANTGNPVRAAIGALMDEAPSGRDTLVILGGSQGAESLNTAILDLLAAGRLSAWRGRIVHQTGAADLDRVRAAYFAAGLAARVEPFIEDLVPIYAAAGLAISRAGATTLAELACAGCPAILLPYKQATRDHQRVNAEWYVQRGAALLADDGELSEQFCRLAGDDLVRKEMGRAMWATARPDAAATVARQITAAAQRSRG